MSTQTTPPSRMDSRQRVILMAILIAIFAIPTSISGTAVALPAIAVQLEADLAPLQWAVTAFNLTFACFTLAWGAIADLFGRKRIFVLCALIYTLASCGSAMATNIVLLDIARAIAGVGAAGVFAAGSAIMATEFDDVGRLRAFALAGAAVGIGVGVGPIVSGVLVEYLGWRSIFVVHGFIMGSVLLIAPLLRPHATIRLGSKFDLFGTLLFLACALCLCTSIVQGAQWGWTSRGVLGLAILALLLFVLFVFVERKRQHPMIDLTLLKNRRFLGWSLATVTPSFGFFTLLTWLPTYLTSIEGQSTTATGFIMLLLAFPLFVCPVIAGKWVQRGMSARNVLMVSLILLLMGDLAFAVLGPAMPSWWFSTAIVFIGAGTGLCAGLADGQALGSVTPEQSGVAAGFLNTLRLGSETIAIALYGALLATRLEAVMLNESLGSFENLHSLVNSVVAGNVAAALQLVHLEKLELSHGIVVSSFHLAFQQVLGVLTLICLVLAISIMRLLRSNTHLQHLEVEPRG